MQLDFHTLSFVIVIVHIISFIVMVYLWRINPRVEGPFIWAVTVLLALIGFSAILLRPQASDYLTNVIHNFCALTATLLILVETGGRGD